MRHGATPREGESSVDSAVENRPGRSALQARGESLSLPARPAVLCVEGMWRSLNHMGDIRTTEPLGIRSAAPQSLCARRLPASSAEPATVARFVRAPRADSRTPELSGCALARSPRSARRACDRVQGRMTRVSDFRREIRPSRGGFARATMAHRTTAIAPPPISSPWSVPRTGRCAGERTAGAATMRGVCPDQLGAAPNRIPEAAGA